MIQYFQHCHTFYSFSLASDKSTPFFALKFGTFILIWLDDLSSFFTLSHLFYLSCLKNVKWKIFYLQTMCLKMLFKAVLNKIKWKFFFLTNHGSQHLRSVLLLFSLGKFTNHFWKDKNLMVKNPNTFFCFFSNEKHCCTFCSD